MTILTWLNKNSCKTMLRLCCTLLSHQNEIGQQSRKCPVLSLIYNNRILSFAQMQTQTHNSGGAENDVESSGSNMLPKSDILHFTKHRKEMMNYLCSKENLKNIHPMIEGRYIKKRLKYPETQFLVDKDIAIEMIEAIKSDLLKDDSHVFEFNPGPGVITEQLLLNNINNLQLFEGDSHFILNLNALIVLHRKKVSVTSFNFLHLGSVIYQDQRNNTSNFDNLMKNVKCKKWEDSPVVKLIGIQTPTLGSKNDLIKHLIYNIIFQCGFVNYGRPELYLVMHPATYLQFTSDSSAGYMLYRSSSVLFRLLFESKIIKKIPRNTVLPWCLKYVFRRHRKLHKINKVDSEQMYFVKVTARSDLFSVIQPDLLKPFWYFLRFHLFSRKNKVIPLLERWIPGCGPRLVAEGFTIFTEFGELTPLQLLSVFKHFTSWPEFNSCPFLPSMETSLLKLELGENEDILQDEDVDDGGGVGDGDGDEDFVEDIESENKIIKS